MNNKIRYVSKREAEKLLTQPNAIRFVEDVRKPYEPIGTGLVGVVNGEDIVVKVNRV